MTSAFAGVRIVDLSSAIPGAYCAKLLADHGANVVIVEPPAGKSLRFAGPFHGGIEDPERCGLFLYLNLNKRSVLVDCETTEGAQQLGRLLEWADVVVLDEPPGAFDLPAIPRLIVARVTPFGSTGPRSGWLGSDLIAMAMSGIMNSTPGNVDDVDRQPPLRVGGRQGDYAAGIVAAFATCLALIDRARTGLGQLVDVSELETLASFMFYETAGFSYDPEGMYVRRVADRRLTGGYPRTSIGIWPCKDGYVCIAIREQHHFDRFAHAIGDPEWSRDERFMSRAARGESRDTLNPLILEWSMQHTVREIWQMAQANDLPITPCNDVGQLVGLDQLRARDFFVEVEQPGVGSVAIPRGPARFSASPWHVARPAPRLGQHTVEVLLEVDAALANRSLSALRSK